MLYVEIENDESLCRKSLANTFVCDTTYELPFQLFVNVLDTLQ